MERKKGNIQVNMTKCTKKKCSACIRRGYTESDHMHESAQNKKKTKKKTNSKKCELVDSQSEHSLSISYWSHSFGFHLKHTDVARTDERHLKEELFLAR